MCTRLTDSELEQRSSALYAYIAALGLSAGDGSAATMWQIEARIKEAIAAGRMTRNSRGHYALTREFFDAQQRANAGRS